MSIIVQKFGGTSVENPKKIKAVADKVAKFASQGHKIVVVVSAMSGQTNKLISLAKEMMKSPEPREMDTIVSTGEQITSGLTALALINLGIKAKSYAGHQVKILTNKSHTKARIENIDSKLIKKDLNEGYVVVVAGFQGSDIEGNITTLGRGGSDTTAVALAVSLKADECQIYTDVDGIYTTDPRVVPEARKLDSITFEEILEMASLGSKVLQTRAVEFAGKYKIKLRVLSSFQTSGEGTIITFEDKKNMEDPIISGIAFNKDEAKITILGVPDMPGIAYQILGPIAESNIDVDMIIQNIGILTILAVTDKNIQKSLHADLKLGDGTTITIDSDLKNHNDVKSMLSSIKSLVTGNGYLTIRSEIDLEKELNSLDVIFNQIWEFTIIL